MYLDRIPRRLSTGTLLAALFLALGHFLAAESKRAEGTADEPAVLESDMPPTARIGVLLVSHGSHSPVWRKMLDEFCREVEPQLLKLSGISGVKSAFMEYSEPSIATALKDFDEEGYNNVVLVPLLLTVSSHSFDDIPTIIGAKEDAKSLMMMEADGIERYRPKAKVVIAPLLDFSSLLEQNLPRRVKALSKDASREGVLLVAYGDETYNDEWESFFARIDEAVRAETGVAEVVHCWCGHIVNYSKDPTKKAIRHLLKRHERAVVIPVLVARDSNFQDSLIGTAIEELDLGDKVAYTPDAILPDAKLNEWVIAVTKQTRNKLQGDQSNQGGQSP